MLKRSRSVRVGAGVIRIVHKCRRIGMLSPFSSVNFSMYRDAAPAGISTRATPHQILIPLTVKTVAVRGFLEEAEENRHIRGTGRHLNGHALLAEITMTITVTGAHSP